MVPNACQVLIKVQQLAKICDEFDHTIFKPVNYS